MAFAFTSLTRPPLPLKQSHYGRWKSNYVNSNRCIKKREVTRNSTRRALLGMIFTRSVTLTFLINSHTRFLMEI